MQYEYFYEPLTHLIVEDFFDDAEYELVYDLIVKLNDMLGPGTYVKNHVDSVDLSIKKNKNLWLYSAKSDDAQKLVKIIEDKMWSEKMRTIYFESLDSSFQYYNKTNQSSILLSEYNKGDYYNWHQDLLKSVTANIWIAKDVVEGGDLILKSVKDKEKTIKYKSNMCIFFPSECLHCVTEVKNDSSRYSIQYFSSMNYEI